MKRNPTGRVENPPNRLNRGGSAVGSGSQFVGNSRHPDANEIAAALKDYSEKRVDSKPVIDGNTAVDQKQALVALGKSLRTTLRNPPSSQANRNAKWAQLMTPPKPAVRSVPPPGEYQNSTRSYQVQSRVQLAGSGQSDNRGKQSAVLVTDMSQPVQSSGPQKPVMSALLKKTFLKKHHQKTGAETIDAVSNPVEDRRPRHDSESYEPRSDDDNKRKSLRIYFGIRPVWTIYFSLFGLFGMFHPWRYHPVYGFEVSIDWVFLGGLILIILGVLWRYSSRAKAGDSQVDRWTMEDIGTLELRAHDLMNVSHNEMLCEPLAFVGYPDLERIKGIFRHSRYGKDQVLRFTPRALTVLCFTREEVIVYEGAIDLTTGNLVYESVRHFFYKDITTVGMVKSVIVKDLWNASHLGGYLAIWRWSFIEYFLNIISGNGRDRSAQNKTREIYRIGLADGSSVSIILRDGRFSGDRINEEIPISTDDAVLQFALEIITKRKNRQMGKTDYNVERPALFVPSTRR